MSVYYGIVPMHIPDQASIVVPLVSNQVALVPRLLFLLVIHDTYYIQNAEDAVAGAKAGLLNIARINNLGSN